MKEKIEKLVRTLNIYSDAYYNRVPLVEDSEFDALYDELVRLEEETGYVLENSPTRNVGFEVVSNLEKVKHKRKLMSLRKTKNIADIMGKLGSEKCISSLKLDGLTTEIEYKNGKLFRASTRGDGVIGEDITHSVKVYKNIPLTLTKDIDITVVGESIIKLGDFKHMNSKLSEGDKFKNPRNAVAGTVRNLDSKVTKNRNVRFIAFDITRVSSEYKQDTYVDTLNFLSELGFNTVPNMDGSALVIFEQLKKYAELTGFGIDGIVVRVNDNNKYDIMGQNSKYPHGAIAYKFGDEYEETTLIDIEWTIGRSGVLTPVAVFEEVELDGSTVARASLHNISNMERIDLGGVGSTVKVVKSNQIIPQIIEVTNKQNEFEIPSTCPYCKKDTEIKMDNQSKILHCTNEDCCERLVMNLSHFVSRGCMNINGLSEQIIRTFVSHGLISSAIDIYSLHKHEKYISSIEGFGSKSTKAIIKNIDISRNTDISKFINALGIQTIGATTSRDIGLNIKSVDKLFDMKVSDWCDMLGEVKGISIANYFKRNMVYIKLLVKELSFEDNETISTDKLGGKRFCLTGSCEQFKNRDELKSYIQANGGIVSTGVSAKTDYLICNQIEDSSKFKKAIHLGIPIIREIDLMEMCK